MCIKHQACVSVLVLCFSQWYSNWTANWIRQECMMHKSKDGTTLTYKLQTSTAKLLTVIPNMMFVLWFLCIEFKKKGIVWIKTFTILVTNDLQYTWDVGRLLKPIFFRTLPHKWDKQIGFQNKIFIRVHMDAWKVMRFKLTKKNCATPPKKI